MSIERVVIPHKYREERRAVESIFTPPDCPTCGHKCMGGVPDAKEQN